jgi:hypothetical protein
MSNIGFFAYNASITGYTLKQAYKYLQTSHNLFVFHSTLLTKDMATVDKTDPQFASMYDISYLSINDIIQLITKLNIKLFIFYTFQSKIDKILWKLCVLLQIPVVLHDHGIVYGTQSARKPIKLTKQMIFRNFQVLKKNVQFYVFLHKNLERNQKKSLMNQINDYKFKYYVFYSKKNMEYYQNFFILNKHNVVLISVPLFDTYNDILLLRKQKTQRKLLYIHQPFRKFDFTTLSFEAEIAYIKKINAIAKMNSFNLEIRFHPTESVESYNCLVNEPNIIITNEIDLSLQAASSYAILGHWSTALAIAGSLKKPLIIIKYPDIVQKMRIYYSIYKNVGYYCKDLFELNDVLKKIDVKDYIYEQKEVEWNDLIGSTNTVEANCEKINYIIDQTIH